jgi:deazaflavin-dependent oxidoreductase (nitroreductase family)
VDLTDLPDTGTFELTTLGRRSGQPRTVEIWFVRSGGVVHVTGTPGSRHWLANVRAHPGVSVRWRGHEVEAVAEEVSDPREREEVVRTAWRLQPWYASQPYSVADWVDRAPVVRLRQLTSRMVSG